MKTILFIHSKEVAKDTMAFHFEKPGDFTFRAGQTIDLLLPNLIEMDAQGNKRSYTIASAPYEKELMITTRMRGSAYKKALTTLSHGDTVMMDGPFGSMILHNNTGKPAVFLAGGIGITPFRSMALQVTHDKLAHQIYLFYSNRRAEDAAFLDELKGVQNPNFHFIPTMTQAEEWEGETGYINEVMLRRYVEDLNTPIYYIAGPPPMVAGMYALLVKAGVDTDNIRTDEFAGY